MQNVCVDGSGRKMRGIVGKVVVCLDLGMQEAGRSMLDDYTQYALAWCWCLVACFLESLLRIFRLCSGILTLKLLCRLKFMLWLVFVNPLFPLCLDSNVNFSSVFKSFFLLRLFVLCIIR